MRTFDCGSLNGGPAGRNGFVTATTDTLKRGSSSIYNKN
jgi:hypothetical protein